MAKTKPADTEGEESTVISMTEISRDNGNGILVYKTNATDGTEFTLKVDDSKIESTSKGGQVWFYAEHPFYADTNIRLK